MGLAGAGANKFVITAVQITAPAKKPETLHCWTVVTGAVEVVVVVVHVPPPPMISAFVPTHFVIVTVDGGDAESAPVAVTKLSTTTVQRRPSPPLFCMALH